MDQELRDLALGFEHVKLQCYCRLNQLAQVISMSQKEQRTQVTILKLLFDGAMKDSRIDKQAADEAMEASELLRVQNKELKSEVERVRGWFKTRKDKVPQLESEVAKLREELAEAAAKLEAMPKPDEDAVKLKEENAELAKELKVKRWEAASLKKENQKLKGKAAELRVFNQTLEQNCADLRSMHEGQKKGFQDLQLAFAEQAIDNGKLVEEVAELQFILMEKDREASQRESNFRRVLGLIGKRSST